LAAIEVADERIVLRLALSDHAVGGSLASALASLRVALPRLVADVSVGLSSAMREAYDKGEVDAAIVRQEGERRDGTMLFADPLVWARDPALAWRPGEPVPLVALHGPCGVKSASTRALDTAGIAWRLAFQGGSVMALQAAVRAGLGVGAMGARHIPEGCIVDESLPELPVNHVMLHTRLDGPTRRVLSAAFKAVGIKA
jgi:DNA-binding transcriptional LysR family regulator